MQPPAGSEPRLRRTLNLPLLVFYGLGVTVGAGIFALIGEILAIAGDRSPLSFLLAGAIAGATGISYALLVRVFPRSGGEAVFVTRGLGPFLGRLVGFGVSATAIISSATIALAFSGYMRALVALPEPVLVGGIIVLLAVVAWWGIRESVIFAALITVLEVGTLVVVIVFGLPLLKQTNSLGLAFSPGLTAAGVAPVLSGAVIAFFAFIGFEDIENMAEETVAPERTVPRAIMWTLGITVVLYACLSLIAVAVPDRAAITGSGAPLAVLFEKVTGLPGEPVAMMAAIAMINGILVQIVMAARVLYGMAEERLLPAAIGKIDPWRKTPARATILVAAAILVLAFAFPLVGLAEATSAVTMTVFALVNLSLFTLGRRHSDIWLRRMRWWGLFAALICIAILVFQMSSL